MTVHWMHTIDENGKSPLDRAFRSKHPAIADFMLAFEKYGRAELAPGSMPLHRAASLGLHEAVRSLLHFGTNPNVQDALGETPLHKAVREGYVAIVRELSDSADVNKPSSLGMTPLHWAALTGDVEIASTLIAAGADPHLHNDALDGLTPADLAEVMGYEELADIMSSGETVIA